MGGNFPWIPSDTASPPETGRSVQTQLCPVPDLARCPGGESGKAVFPLAPDSLEGRGQGSQVPCMADDPAARAWRKHPGMVQEFRVRVSTVGTGNPRGGPGAVKIPRPSSSPTPTGAISGTCAQSCQSSTQAGHSPSMWALPAVLQNPVWLQSTPDALGALPVARMLAHARSVIERPSAPLSWGRPPGARGTGRPPSACGCCLPRPGQPC